MAALRRMAKVMKKMTFGIIFIIVLGLLVFAGCVSFSKSGINVDDAVNEAALDEYETLIANAMDIPVTDASGEQVTNEAGEKLTTSVFVETMTVPVTDAAGETVTNAAGEQQTEKVYVEKDSGKIVSNSSGEVKTTVAYKDKKTGEVVATTVAPATTQKAESTTKSGGKSNNTTTAKSNDTTKAGSQNTTQPTSQSASQPASTGGNEFDYLKSGNFYIKGTMTDSSGQSLPLEMAVTANSIYMLSRFENADIGMLINDGTTYMIYPAEKAYLELSSTVLKAMGMSTDDLISSADLDYSQYDLAKADSTTTENVNGANCTVYVYNSSSGSTRFFLNGNKLVRFATYDANGNADVINDVSYITNNVPAEKINPPADYKEYKGLTGMFSFISLLGDVVSDE